MKWIVLKSTWNWAHQSPRRHCFTKASIFSSFEDFLKYLLSLMLRRLYRRLGDLRNSCLNILSICNFALTYTGDTCRIFWWTLWEQEGETTTREEGISTQMTVHLLDDIMNPTLSLITFRLRMQIALMFSCLPAEPYLQ